jgi:hypothetical protein
MPAAVDGNASLKSDDSKSVFFNAGIAIRSSAQGNSRFVQYQTGVTVRPANAIKVSLQAEYARNSDNFQYVTTVDFAGRGRTILGHLDEQTLGFTLRIDWNMTPEMSLQYYGSPFAAVGQYSGFKRVTNPRAEVYEERFAVIPVQARGDELQLGDLGEGSAGRAIANPDFSFSQFRSNLVFRWEYVAGSQLYLVWSGDITTYSGIPVSLWETLMSGKKRVPQNIFAAKLSYWFSL